MASGSTEPRTISAPLPPAKLAEPGERRGGTGSASSFFSYFQMFNNQSSISIAASPNGLLGSMTLGASGPLASVPAGTGTFTVYHKLQVSFPYHTKAGTGMLKACELATFYGISRKQTLVASGSFTTKVKFPLVTPVAFTVTSIRTVLARKDSEEQRAQQFTDHRRDILLMPPGHLIPRKMGLGPIQRRQRTSEFSFCNLS
ncbi:hypothetical protein BGW80DRAFT_1254605 [Lactifluus volemus]|nr:hypothetical protein BGW80DRAFT_1254605 [Lactifluus volemus]